MSFWNNPEYNSLKMLLLVVVVAGAGAFAYYEMNNGGNTGRLIGTTSVATGVADTSSSSAHRYLPTVVTNTPPTAITGTTATLHGTVTGLGVGSHVLGVFGGFKYAPVGGGPGTGRSVPATFPLLPTITTITGGSAPYEIPVSGLTCDTAYTYQAIATQLPDTTAVGGGDVMTFHTAPCGVNVVAGTPDLITASGARFHASVRDMGAATSVDPFFYYTTADLPFSTGTTYAPTIHAPAMSSAGDYQATVTGLHCGTEYHYAAAADTLSPTGYHGLNGDVHFTTAACATTVTTLTPTYITATSVRLNGTFTVPGATTSDAFTASFNYGTSAIGTGPSSSVVATMSTTAPTGPFSATVTGLRCGTTYHVQAVVGRNVGEDVSFRTYACTTTSGASSGASASGATHL